MDNLKKIKRKNKVKDSPPPKKRKCVQMKVDDSPRISLQDDPLGYEYESALWEQIFDE